MNQNADVLFWQWKQSGKNEDRDKLYNAFAPTVNQVVARYKNYPVSDAAVYGIAAKQLVKAFESYDPNRGASLGTHVFNAMRRVNREVGALQNFVQIPESRRLKIATFRKAEQDLKDRFLRHPSAQELADHLSWPMAEVGRMRREMRGEIMDVASPVLEDFGTDQPGAKTRDAMAYVYPELTAKEKQVFEFTFGYGGAPELKNNAEIARRVGMSETSVRNTKQKIAVKMQPFLG